MIDWRKLCAGARDVQIDGDAVVVTLGRERQHRVDVESKSDAVEFRAVVARRAAHERIEDRPRPLYSGGSLPTAKRSLLSDRRRRPISLPGSGLSRSLLTF